MLPTIHFLTKGLATLQESFFSTSIVKTFVPWIVLEGCFPRYLKKSTSDTVVVIHSRVINIFTFSVYQQRKLPAVATIFSTM